MSFLFVFLDFGDDFFYDFIDLFFADSDNEPVVGFVVEKEVCEPVYTVA